MRILRKDYTTHAWAVQDAIEAHKVHRSEPRLVQEINDALDGVYMNKAQFMTHVLRLTRSNFHDRAKRLEGALEGKAATRAGVVVFGGGALLLVIAAIAYAVFKVVFWM